MLPMRFIALSLILVLPSIIKGQDTKAYLFSGVVYDEQFTPLPYTHVVARGTGQGDMTDSLGIFKIYVRENDILSFYNIAFIDTSIHIQKDVPSFSVHMRKRLYPIKEARIFKWGSSYSEFLDEVERMGPGEQLSEKLELPEQDPGVVPFDKNEELLKSSKFFFSSPISYLYYNYSKQEKSARKVYKLDKDRGLIDRFNEMLSAASIASITGLQGKKLETFMIYLNSNLSCTYTCDEIALMTEILAIWKRYSELH